MSTSLVLRFTGWMLLIGGMVLLVATGNIAVALGTPGPMPADGASDPAAMTFWRQLTFIRMFGTAAIGLGAICVWGGRHLTHAQRSSFLKVLVGVLVLMVVMGQSQQTAIWGANAGWVIVGVLGVAALLCGGALAIQVRQQTV